MFCQKMILLGRFNTLCDQLQIHTSGHRNDRYDEARIIGALVDIYNKASVNFKLVQRESAQVAQRGIARPKVVYRQPYAQLF